MSRYYTQFFHGQITTGLDGRKSIYCETHDRLFQLDLDGISSHPCFEGREPLGMHEIPKPQTGFQFHVNKDRVLDFFSAERLVAEWYNWWAESDIAPNKLPDALHTRSAIYLSQRKPDDTKG